jgi:hypothetical protein
MRNAYFALHGALYGYWGYAPVRPIRRAAAATRFTAAAKAPGPRPLGGLSDLAAPALAPRPPLTPLANALRRPVGGFDSRLPLLKGPRGVRAWRRAT